MVSAKGLALLLLSCMLPFITTFSQDSARITLANSEKLLKTVHSKLDRFDARTSAYTERSLKKLLKLERKMQSMLASKDSALASKMFSYAIDSLEKLQSILQSKNLFVNKYLHPSYLPYADTLQQAFKFLRQVLPGSETVEGLSGSIERIDALGDRLAKIEEIKQFIADRRTLLKNYFKNTRKFARHLQKLNKEVYYYSAQITEYKTVLTDPSRIEEIVATALMKIPDFKSFFEANSQLAGVFGSPMISANSNAIPVNGLPSRLAVQQNIQSSFVSNRSATQFLNQQIGQAQSAMDAIKEKINQFGGMGDKEIPDFKVNPSRTKTFWQRLEYGFDVQFGKAFNLLPLTGDVSFQLGYKLNANSAIGIGALYKLGFGNGWNNIRLSHQGVGFRSFMNYKIKGSYYVQAGGELNHLAGFHSLDQLKNFNAWQPSALIGLSKKYQVGKKLKGNFQILYDALHKVNMPETRPVVFRFGYSF